MFLSYGMTWNVEGTSGYMESRTPRPKIARVIRASRLRGTEGAWSGPRYSSIPARPATAGKTTYVSPQRPAERAGTYRRNTAPMSDNGLVSNGRSMPVPHEIIVRCLPVRSSPVSNLLHLRDTQRTPTSRFGHRLFPSRIPRDPAHKYFSNRLNLVLRPYLPRDRN